MLPKEQRINLSKEFRWMLSGVRKESPSFIIYIKEGENGFPRVGIALKKANFKKAHDRNKARRLVSASVKTLYHSLRRNINLVIMPKPEIFKRSSEELINELKSIENLY